MKRLLSTLRTLAYGWLVALWDLLALIARMCRKYQANGQLPERQRRTIPGHCVPVNVPAFVKPDPLLYSQFDLMKRGLAVTWDNPDIQLWRGGVPVSSSSLDPGTTYEVVARVWNGSPDAPVVDMPVHFSFLEFGVGTVSHAIGTTKVTVGVKGGPGHPASAKMAWTTPSTPGHYCLQVLLDPFDDSNFQNNLGQENTNVGKAHSPAVFTFALRNDTRREHRYRFEADAYTIPAPPPCSEQRGRAQESKLAPHRYGAHPLPAGWAVACSPETPSLASGASTAIQVTVTPPAGWTGSQNVNVNVFHEEALLVGGVTLTVQAP